SSLTAPPAAAPQSRRSCRARPRRRVARPAAAASFLGAGRHPDQQLRRLLAVTGSERLGLTPQVGPIWRSKIPGFWDFAFWDAALAWKRLSNLIAMGRSWPERGVSNETADSARGVCGAGVDGRGCDRVRWRRARGRGEREAVPQGRLAALVPLGWFDVQETG